MPHMDTNLTVKKLVLVSIGPSFAVDMACSSSLLALDQALRATRTGQCDVATVGFTKADLDINLTNNFPCFHRSKFCSGHGLFIQSISFRPGTESHQDRTV